MANNILQQLAQQQPPAQSADMMQQLVNFRNSFKGDPQQAVMNMLKSGQINNAQLQQAIAQAKQISKLLH